MHTGLKDGPKGSEGGVEAGLHEDRIVCVGDGPHRTAVT